MQAFPKSAVSKKGNFSEISVTTFINSEADSEADKKRKFILFEYDTRDQAIDAYLLSRKHPKLCVRCQLPMPTSKKSSGSNLEITFYVPTSTQVIEIKNWMTPPDSRSLCDMYNALSYSMKHQLPTIYMSSAEFRWFFGTLINSLGEMHMAGHFHGKLKTGVFFDAEKRILLANFDTSKRLNLLNGMKKDLSELIEMMREAKGELESNCWPNDFEDFRAKVNGLNISNHTNKFHLYFVYNHPMFFTAKEGISFIHSFVAFTKSHFVSGVSVKYGPEVDGWWAIIESILAVAVPGHATLIETYLHNAYHYGEVINERGHVIVKNNYRYIDRKFGSFLRNCLQHKSSLDEESIFLLLKLIWPEMLVWLHDGLRRYGETYLPEIKMHFSVYTWQVSEYKVETYKV